MSEKKKVTLTHQQWQALFVASVNFVMPEKLGEDPIPYMERRDAEIEVLHLYRELKPLSPLYLKVDTKHILFGPVENWKKGEVNIEGKMVGTHEFRNPGLEISVTLDEDAYLGAERILQLRLHSGSGRTAPIWEREDVMWPVAARLRLTKKLRRLLKLEDRQKRRLELDEMLSNEGDNGNKAGEEATEPKKESEAQTGASPDAKKKATTKA